jgi:hypothetical protein
MLVWLVFGVATEAGYLAWALWSPAGPAYGARLALYLFLFAAAVAAAALARGRTCYGRDLHWALALAALFRLTLLGAPPTLSSDIYRYLWDGKVQLHGFNPYRYAPSDPALVTLRDAHHPFINHPEVPTIYPPLSQMLFAAAAAISPTPIGMKALVVLAELGGWVALVQIWRLRGLTLASFLLYLWNPLVIVEGSGSGHNDALGVGLLLCSGLLIILGRPGVSIVALSGSIAAKFFPVMVLPLWLKVVPRRFWALPPLVWLALWWPYLGAGSRLWEGLRAYATHWESSTLLFHGLKRGLEWIDPKPQLDEWWSRLCFKLGHAAARDWIWPYTEPRQLAKLLVAVGLGVALVAWLGRRSDLEWSSFRMLGLALLWAPTLYPWYLQWILPFAARFCSFSWFVLSATAFLSYAPAGWGGLGADGLRWMQYGPFLLAWAAEEIIRRRLRRI